MIFFPPSRLTSDLHRKGLELRDARDKAGRGSPSARREELARVSSELEEERTQRKNLQELVTALRRELEDERGKVERAKELVANL